MATENDDAAAARDARRRRGPRRATRPATGGDPTVEVPVLPGDDYRPQPDEQRAARGKRGTRGADGRSRDPDDAHDAENRADRWLREQRPPHWE